MIRNVAVGVENCLRRGMGTGLTYHPEQDKPIELDFPNQHKNQYLPYIPDMYLKI